MPTLQEEVALLTTATNNLITEVSTKKQTLDDSEAQAVASAAAALASEQASNADAIATAADRVVTTADRVSTNADKAYMESNIGTVAQQLADANAAATSVLELQTALTNETQGQDYIFTAVGGETMLEGKDDNGMYLDLNGRDIEVFINRAKYHVGTEVNAGVNERSVVFTTPLTLNDVVVIHTRDIDKTTSADYDYNMNDVDIFGTDRVLRDGARPFHHAQMFASNYIYLNGIDQSVPYDIPYTLGSEEVANGDFGTTDLTWWSFINGSGIVVSGELETTSSTINLTSFYTFDTIVGNSYVFSFDCRAGTQVGHQYSVYNIADNQEITGKVPYNVNDGNVSIVFVATGTSTRVYTNRDGITTLGTTYFDNVSVKQITNHDIPYEVDGVELVTNGTFDTDTVWTKGSGWTVDAGDSNVATATAPSAGNLEQYINHTIGKTYLVTYTITAFTSGTSLSAQLGSTNGEGRTSAGTYSDIITPTTSGWFKFQASSDFTGSIDNVSVKEVTLGSAHLTTLPKAGGSHVTYGNSVEGGSSEELVTNGGFDTNDFTGWTLGASALAGGVSASTGQAVWTSPHSDYAEIKQLNQSVIGRRYKGSFEVVSKVDSATQAWIHYGRTLISNVAISSLAVGVHDFDVISSHTDGFSFSVRTDGVITIDNISAMEVMPVSTTYDITESHANTFTTDVALTDADRVLLDNNPNLVAQLYFGDLTTGLSFSAGNVKNLWLGNGGVNTGAYEQDLTSATSADTVDTSVWEYNVFTGVGSSSIVDTYTVSFTGAVSWYNRDTTALTIGKNYIVVMTLSGVTSSSIKAEIGGAEVISYVSADGVYVGYIENALTTYLSTRTGGAGFTGVCELHCFEATAKEIANYTANCRTTEINNTYGVSNLFLKQDATGRAIGIADANTIEFNGDGRYIDTGWIHNYTEDFTVEFVIDYQADGTVDRFGSYSATLAKHFEIYKHTDDRFYFYLGDNNQSYLPSAGNGLKHMIISYSSTGVYDVYENNVLKLDDVASAFSVLATDSFLIGKANVTYMNNRFGLFKVHKNKALTATEVATAYAKAKLIYPTLP